MVVAVALVLLVVGSVLFHYLSPWYFTPIASNWDAIDQTVTITFWVTGFVFVTVNLFMAIACCATVTRRENGALRTRKQEAGGSAILGTTGGDRDAGPACMGEVIGSPRTRRCSRWPGVELQLSRPGEGRCPRHRRRRSDEEPVRHEPDDPTGGRYLIASPQLHLPMAAELVLDRRPCTTHGAAVPLR